MCEYQWIHHEQPIFSLRRMTSMLTALAERIKYDGEREGVKYIENHYC